MPRMPTHLTKPALSLFLVALLAAQLATAAPPRSAQAVAGYRAQLISDCEQVGSVFRIHQPDDEYGTFKLTPTAAAKVTGKSICWQVATKTGASAVLELQWRPDAPADYVALWLKNPHGHRLSLTVELNLADDTTVALGTQALGEELNWQQLAYAVPTTEIEWSAVGGLLLRLSGLQPQATYELYIDEVEAYRAPPLVITVENSGGEAAIAAGAPLSLELAVKPAESRPSWPELGVEVAQGSFVVARTALEFTQPRPEADRTAISQPTTIRLPEYLAPGDYEVRVAGEVQTTGGSPYLRLTVENQRPAPRISVQAASGQGAILCDGRPVAPLLLEAPAAPADQRSGPQQLLLLDATSDYDLYGRSADVWLARDRFDYSDLDRRLGELLLARPDALVMLRVYVGSPPWWDAENPDELVKFGDGSVHSPPRVPGRKHSYASWASAKWREAAGKALVKLVEHVESLPAGRAVAGYLLCSGEWGNWQYPGASRELFCDYSAAQHEAYRKWLRDSHGSLGALRVAWGQPLEPVTTPEAIADGQPILGWHQVKIPTPKQRVHSYLGVLRDPAGEQDLIDYDLFASAVIVATINELAAAIKQSAPGKLCGANYGHLFDQARYRYALQNGGHLAVGLALQSEQLDFLTAPAIGLPSESVDLATFGGCESSINSHHKLLIYEWPAYVHRDYSEEWVKNKLAQALCAGCATSVPAGVFEGEAGAQFSRAARIAAAANRESAAEIAVVVDDVSVAYTVCGNELTGPLLDEQRRAITLLGAPVDVWLLDDVLSGRAPLYKLYLFLNAFYLPTADREALRAELARAKATAVYVYAAGAIDQNIGGRTAKHLTGITIVPLRSEGLLQVALPEGAGTYGTRSPVSLRFICEGSAADVMAWLLGTTYGGLAALDTEDGTVVWSGAPNLPSSILRDLALDAGVHVYAEPGDAVYACKELVGIRAGSPGRHSVHLPAAADVYDCFSGQLLAPSTTEVTLALEKGEVALLYVGGSPPQLQ